MPLLRLPCSLSLPSISAASSSSSPHHHRPKPRHKPAALPARDRVIDFGKHKGRMLGSLPSAYLLWVSKTLRAGDSLPWAELADQVLADPVYRDRIEWEAADRLLSGNHPNTSRASSSASPVSSLLEISERFGWDNDDKAGWARVDFELLGTSKGGRIPRVKKDRPAAAVGVDESDDGEDEKFGVGGKREERRERRRAKKREEPTAVSREEAQRGDSGRGRDMRVASPFPGRAALLDKIRRGGGNGIGL